MSDHIPSTWYADFFTELPNEFWRRAASPAMTESDVAFVRDRLNPSPGSTILDVPCGSGRHSLALAALGYRVTGFDISGEAITYARQAADRAGVNVEFVHAEMREIPRSGAFDAAVCLGNSFGYLEIDGTREFVSALAGAVRAGGGLVVDTNVTAETVLPGYNGDARTMQTGDISVDVTTEYDIESSRLISRYRFTRGEQVLDTTAVHHVYTSGHLGRLLADGGFTDIRRYSGPDGRPYELGAGRLILTARRS